MQAYPGAARSADEIAILRPSVGLAGTQILLESVDGRALRWPQEGAKLLPGLHRLRVSLVLRSGIRQRVHRFDLRFEARAGERYQLFGELSTHGPRLWIADGAFETVAEADSGLIPPPVGSGSLRSRPVDSGAIDSGPAGSEIRSEIAEDRG